MSQRFRKEYLSIIHDKIDKTKTSIPRLRLKSKSIVGTNLGLSLIGMLTHGHNIESVYVNAHIHNRFC